MVPDHTSLKRQQIKRLRTRFVFCGMVVSILLAAAGFIYLNLFTDAEPTPWREFCQPLLAVLALTLAFIVNLQFNIPASTTEPVAAPDSDNPTRKALRKIRPPAQLLVWLKHVAHIAITASCAALAIYLTTVNLNAAPQQIPPLSNVIPVGSVFSCSSQYRWHCSAPFRGLRFG